MLERGSFQLPLRSSRTHTVRFRLHCQDVSIINMLLPDSAMSLQVLYGVLYDIRDLAFLTGLRVLPPPSLLVAPRKLVLVSR